MLYPMRYLLPLLLLALFGCVSQKKYQEAELARDRYRAEAAELSTLRTQQAAATQELADTRGELRARIAELDAASAENRRLTADYRDMENRYTALLTQNKNVLSNSADEKAGLQQQLAVQQRELDAQRRQLQSLSTNLSSQQQDLVALQTDLATREARVAELEQALAAKDDQMRRLRTDITRALRNFTAADLTVSERNGNIYVSLSQNLLFKSGSDRIDQSGRDAIRQLADVLQRTTTDVGILVEGHTDTDGTESVNWDLSTDRAVRVARLLIDGGVQAERVTAAGRAFYRPVAPNDTAENKARNRRVEVILSPNLEGLYQLVTE